MSDVVGTVAGNGMDGILLPASSVAQCKICIIRPKLDFKALEIFLSSLNVE